MKINHSVNITEKLYLHNLKYVLGFGFDGFSHGQKVNVSHCFQTWYLHSTSHSESNNICYTKIDQIVLETFYFKN